jgi:hypothetical protein
VVFGTWSFVHDLVARQQSVESIFLALAAILTALAIALIYYRRRLASPARLVIVTAVSVVVIVSATYQLLQFKNMFRIPAYAGCSTLSTFIPRYWVAGLRALESERQPRRIAFTYGPQQVCHQSFIAPFLGSHLSNFLGYVSPNVDGAIVPHDADYLAAAHLSFDTWIEALHSAGATHVLCLEPPCTELRWMQARPGLFACLTPRNSEWGLFRIEWSKFERSPEHLQQDRFPRTGLSRGPTRPSAGGRQ